MNRWIFTQNPRETRRKATTTTATTSTAVSKPSVSCRARIFMEMVIRAYSPVQLYHDHDCSCNESGTFALSTLIPLCIHCVASFSDHAFLYWAVGEGAEWIYLAFIFINWSIIHNGFFIWKNVALDSYTAISVNKILNGRFFPSLDWG